MQQLIALIRTESLMGVNNKITAVVSESEKDEGEIGEKQREDSDEYVIAIFTNFVYVILRYFLVGEHGI